jgi:hypothetical protein
MRSFENADSLAGRTVAISGDDHAFVVAGPKHLERLRQLGCPLSRTDDDRPAFGWIRKLTGQCLQRVGGGDSGVKKTGQEMSGIVDHLDLGRKLFSPYAISVLTGMAWILARGDDAGSTPLLYDASTERDVT